MTKRVYIPSTIATLRSWLDVGAAPAPLSAHTVTREFARDYELPDAPDDDEMLRFEALTDAGLASADLVRTEGENRAAVVVEADLDDASIGSTPGDGSSVSVLIDVAFGSWVAVYLESPAARDARDAPGSPTGDGDVASFGDADLTWFAVQELADALEEY
jgi:hypothetical protein